MRPVLSLCRAYSVKRMHGAFVLGKLTFLNVLVDSVSRWSVVSGLESSALKSQEISG
ncbi:hypothetical protein STEG23_008812, partial [Scotinomys teguina]